MSATSILGLEQAAAGLELGRLAVGHQLELHAGVAEGDAEAHAEIWRSARRRRPRRR